MINKWATNNKTAKSIETAFTGNPLVAILKKNVPLFA
jgi:hypothetical protein